MDDLRGCQSADADAFCKLKLCDEDAYAIDYDTKHATYEPGFGCDRHSKSYGDWFGMDNIKFSQNVKSAHAPGDSVQNVKCHAKGNFSNYSSMASCLNH